MGRETRGRKGDRVREDNREIYGNHEKRIDFDKKVRVSKKSDKDRLYLSS